MRKYSSNLAFVDMLFNLLIGFTSLFILSFLLINPIADQGKIDPVTQLMLTLEWDENFPTDLDIHVKTPNGDVISFRHKDNGWMVLDRDDLGSSSDVYVVNGIETVVPKNMEVININAIVPGEYVVNVHHYSAGPLHQWKQTVPEELREFNDNMYYNVTLIDMHPFKIKMSRDMEGLKIRKEHTAFTFIVDEEGNVADIRTDIRIPLFTAQDTR